MGKNFFLDNDYTQKQVESINKVKSKKNNTDSTKKVKGNSNSIFDDINSYKNDKNKQTDNSDLFKYIEQTIGMESMLDLLDADGNGEISKTEAENLSKLDGKDGLDSSDIGKFVSDVSELKSAKSTKKENNKSTEYTYKTDSNGNLIKESAKVTDTKKKKVTAIYEYDENGRVKSKNDKIKNQTTTYKYDKNGKKISSKTTANNKNKTLKHESFYDENGRVKSKKVYVNSETGLKTNRFCTYQYDKNGKKIGMKIYEGDSAKGKLKGDYTYTYDEKTGQLKYRTNNKNSNRKYFKYDSDGNIVKAIYKDKTGKTTATCYYNEDGTFAIKKTDKYTELYEYDGAGIRTKSKKYKNKDVDKNNQPKNNALPIREIEYTDGKETKRIERTSEKTSYYTNGKLTAETKGNYTYVYEYDSNGKKTTKKYNTSDCVDGVPNKSAKPIATSAVSDSIVELARSLIGCNAQDGSADKFVKGVGDDASTTAWCSEFAKYVLQHCGHYDELPDWYKNLPDTRDDGKNAACSIHQAAKDAGAVVSAAEAQPGDLVLFRDDSDSLASHTGLVLKIENGKLYTIEGNTLGEGGRSSVRTLTYDNANSDRFVYCKVTP